MKPARLVLFAGVLAVGLLGTAQGTPEHPLRPVPNARHAAVLSTAQKAAAVTMNIMQSSEHSLFRSGFE